MESAPLEGIDRARLRAEIEDLVVESAYLLDRGRFGEMLDLYTDDCEMTRPLPPFTGPETQTIRGKAALAAWYRDPGAWPPGPRTMRHVVANLRLAPLAEDRAAGTLVLIGYRFEGAGISAAQPMMVGDYEDEYLRGQDGRWRIHRRRVVIVFLNPELIAAAEAAARVR